MSKGREPLRIPDHWRGQDRQFVIQLERILDNVYGCKADAEDTKKAIAELAQGISDLGTSKLDKSKVYNGLDKSTSGFALDARQGKALNDKWGNFHVAGYITSLANLIAYINGLDTNDQAIVHTSSALATSLFGKADTVAAICFVHKASTSNAYFLCVNRNNATFGNISLGGGTVSILHPISEYGMDAGSNTLSYGKMCYGHITNSNNSIYLMYPIHVRPGLSVKSISLTQVTVRGIGGYVMNSVTSFTGYTISASIEDNMLRIRLDRSTAYGTNNTPVVGQVSGTVVLE